MIVSGKFNRFFHAVLAEILKTEKKIEVSTALYTTEIDTQKATLEQLKMFFKMADSSYKKISSTVGYKSVFEKEESIDMLNFFGNPVSTTLLTSSELLAHIVWIKSTCYKNSVHVRDDEWDAIMKHMELIGE